MGLLFWQAPTDLSGTKHSDPPPSELSAAVSGTLGAGGVRATVGANTLTFWWVKELPKAAWSEIPEGTLVGAVKIEKDFRDVRGRTVKAGTFTLRYGIQPANGDHLGVSPYRDFLLLSPAARDVDPAPRGHDGTIEYSKEAIGGSHPAVLSLDPPVASDAPLTVHTNDLGLKALVVEVAAGGGTLKFGLVLIGKIEA